MKKWPALDIQGADDRLLLLLDDFTPTAIEDTASGIRAFFPSPEPRDAARQRFAAEGIGAESIDVPDDDWAVRSQQNLAPVTVGGITVVADPVDLPDWKSQARTIVISPSMGFGTGHHATTRLCLAALQHIELENASVLDVGTGSGILAIAAARLGAARVLGLDNDPDAIQAANDNLAVNPDTDQVRFLVSDLTTTPLPQSSVVVANLTGALLLREAKTLQAAATPSGMIILSGLLADEEDDVRRAFGGDARRMQEGEWVCLEIRSTNL